MEINNLKKIIIASISQNGVIGYENNIPWKSKKELLHFKNVTTGSPILMGRKTFDSIGKILDDRLNIVISSNKVRKSSNSNLIYFDSVRKSYLYLKKNHFNKVFICGGYRIYRNTIKHADEMIISNMHFDVMGDLKFPKINQKLWIVVKEEHYNEFTVIYYQRKNVQRI